jgi:hypothetical protein
MTIEDRIRALSKFDCTPLTRPQLDELLSAVKPVASSPASQEFLVADLRPDTLATRLESLGTSDRDVLVCRLAFREASRSTRC